MIVDPDSVREQCICSLKPAVAGKSVFHVRTCVDKCYIIVALIVDIPHGDKGSLVRMEIVFSVIDRQVILCPVNHHTGVFRAIGGRKDRGTNTVGIVQVFLSGIKTENDILFPPVSSGHKKAHKDRTEIRDRCPDLGIFQSIEGYLPAIGHIAEMFFSNHSFLSCRLFTVPSCPQVREAESLRLYFQDRRRPGPRWQCG